MKPPLLQRCIPRLALGLFVCALAACGGSNPAVAPDASPDTAVKPVIRCAP